MTDPDTIAYLKKYADRVGSSMFFYDRVDQMTREELLGVIGWCMEEMDRMQESARREREFLKALRR